MVTCPKCGVLISLCEGGTEAQERERLIRVANADAEWWRMQIELVHKYPALVAFARTQSERFRHIAKALESAQDTGAAEPERP